MLSVQVRIVLCLYCNWPFLSAFRLAISQVKIRGNAAIGRMMQIVPYAHRQLVSWNWFDKGEPAKAVIMLGEEVKA